MDFAPRCEIMSKDVNISNVKYQTDLRECVRLTPLPVLRMACLLCPRGQSDARHCSRGSSAPFVLTDKRRSLPVNLGNPGPLAAAGRGGHVTERWLTRREPPIFLGKVSILRKNKRRRLPLGVTKSVVTLGPCWSENSVDELGRGGSWHHPELTA